MKSFCRCGKELINIRIKKQWKANNGLHYIINNVPILYCEDCKEEVYNENQLKVSILSDLMEKKQLESVLDFKDYEDINIT